MDDNKITVTLTGPAKINGVREPSGKAVVVSTALAIQLAASGVINPEATCDRDTRFASDFDAAVAKAAASLVAVTVDTAVAEAIAGKVVELSAAHDQIRELQKKLVDVRLDTATKLEEAENRATSAEDRAASADKRATAAEQKVAELEAAGSRKK